MPSPMKPTQTVIDGRPIPIAMERECLHEAGHAVAMALAG
jgi:hypothetical protein